VGAAWSSGGRLAIIANPRPFIDGWQNAGLFVRSGAGWRSLADRLDRPVGNLNYGDLFTGGLLGEQEPHWLDEEHVLATVSDRGTVRDEMVSIQERIAGGRLMMLATERARPPELYELADERIRRVTSDGSRWFAPFRRDPERIGSFSTRPRSIDAWLVRGGRGRRPTVLQIHGGPHAMHSGTPWLDMTALAGAGFHVVYANPSGSVGYGEDLARRLHGDWGRADTRELLALLDRLASDGIVDADRVGAMGASYGGFLVNWLAGHHPDRFRALVSENPVTDHVAEWGGADFPFEIAEAAIAEAMIPQRVESLVAASPYRLLNRTKAAMLLMHADGDLRCPPINTDIAFAVLHRSGATVEMIRYPDEPHGLKTNGRPDRRVDRIERIVAWYRSYL
jgi:dipeptidyl aminopeptidase/acylaminoacyl peptidase